MQKIDVLKTENKCLRDQNDELVIELEATKRYIMSNIFLLYLLRYIYVYCIYH